MTKVRNPKEDRSDEHRGRVEDTTEEQLTNQYYNRARYNIGGATQNRQKGKNRAIYQRVLLSVTPETSDCDNNADPMQNYVMVECYIASTHHNNTQRHDTLPIADCDKVADPTGIQNVA